MNASDQDTRTDHPSDRLAALKADMAREAASVGRDPARITVIAVSKTVPAERIAPVLAAGHRDFGENKVQEAEAKWPALRAAHPDLRLHLIGPLQTNKARAAARLFDCVHSLDRPKLVDHLARAAATERAQPLPCLIQVNTGEEPQKAGVIPPELPALIAQVRGCDSLDLQGLMAIPPVDEPAQLHFALLAKLAERHGLSWLSMGMSGDWEPAVRLGATHIRVGTRIFGARPIS